jgi:TPR repeat protein
MTLRQYLPRLTGMLFACCLGAACTPTVSNQAGGIGTPPPGERPLMGNHRFIIPHADLDGLKRMALQGSADAALRLANYHQMILLDPDQAEYWLGIAAENGSIVGMYNLAHALRRSNDASKHARARYWLDRVVKEGPPDLAARARHELGVQPQ